MYIAVSVGMSQLGMTQLAFQDMTKIKSAVFSEIIHLQINTASTPRTSRYLHTPSQFDFLDLTKCLTIRLAVA